jgi:16S rRNA (guanine1516-N2)-methyltransferase
LRKSAFIDPLVVTTSSKSRQRSDAVEEAHAVALRLGVPFVPCVKGVPVETLLSRARCVLVLRADGVVLLDGHGSARWSMGMAHVRARNVELRHPQPDHLLLAGEIALGDHVLDATLGRGQDALVLAQAVGKRGRVLGVEASLPLYAWTSVGMERDGAPVECVHGDALAVLRAQPDASFDVVFFDPMFDKPALHEAGFALVRRHADPSAVTGAMLREARRVAKRWVVVKAAPQSTQLRRLGLTTLPFKRAADLRFGRLDCPTLRAPPQ